MIGISSLTFDLKGSIILRGYEKSSTLIDLSRRITRTATLDGGVDIEDRGLSHGDRTLTVSIKNISKESAGTLKYLIENYAEVRVSTNEGCFLAVIKTHRIRSGDLNLKIFVKSKLTE